MQKTGHCCRYAWMFLWFLSFVPSLALALTVYVCVTYVSKVLAVWLGDCAGALEPHTHLVSQRMHQ
jgi:hypothetical protein